MKRRAILGSSLGFLLAGCRPASPAPTSPMATPTAVSTATPRVVPSPTIAESPGDVLYVRNDYGTRGPGQIAVVDARVDRLVRTLPVGIISPDGSALYATTWSDARTALRAIDPRTGAATAEATVDGVYFVTTLSPNGQWLALQREVSPDEIQAFEKANRWESHVRVLDRTFAGGKEIALDGNFWVDAISADGTSLFLIENLPPIQPYQYRVRLYDLAKGALQDGAIADKTGSEVMSGTRTDSHFAPDGSWLYSLYLNQLKGPFIHALNLAQRFAVCIFLPPNGKEDIEKLFLWTTALTADGRTLYAVNDALGLAAAIDVAQLRVARTARLPVTTAAPSLAARLGDWLLPIAQAKRLLIGGTALSPDGSILYAVGNVGLLAIETASLVLRGHYLSNLTLDSVALSPDGERLYAVSAERATVLQLDPATGSVVATLRGADHPAGILRVAAT